MFFSFIKIFIQHLFLHRAFSLINIIGLALGLACCLLIVLFVGHELSYDRHHRNADEIFLVRQIIPGQEDPGITADYSSPRLAALLQQDFDEVIVAARYVPFTNPMELKGDNASGTESTIRYADNAFLQLFDYTWVRGSPALALHTADEIVLTTALAEKYFGTTDILGRTLTLDQATVLQVTGVIEKASRPTTLDFTALLPVELYERTRRSQGMDLNGWYNLVYQSYFLLAEGVNVSDIQSQFPGFVRRHISAEPTNDDESITLSSTPLTGHDNERSIDISVTPLQDLYMNQNSSGIANGDRVLIFIAIGMTVLMIAIVNFMNLSTSRASTRILEVGLRLSLGSERRQLILHFLGEALIMTALAMAFAIAITELMLPTINGFLGLELGFSQVSFIALILSLLGSTILVGLLAGGYPAFYLTRGKPARVLQGEITGGKAGSTLRSLLVVCQFSMSIGFIVVALVMFSQMNFIRNLNLGYQPNRIVTVSLPDKTHFDINVQWNSLKRHLLQIPGVESISHAIDSPLMNNRFASQAKLDGKDPITLYLVPLEKDYLQQYQIDLVEGRYFNSDTQQDNVPVQPRGNTGSPKGSYILNGQAVRALGWAPEDALGQAFRVGVRGGMTYASVIGVVEDTISLAYDEPLPILYYIQESTDFIFTNGVASLQVDPAYAEGFNERLARSWRDYFTDVPLQYQYLDDVVEGLYSAEQNQMKTFGYSALLAVMIACFGLFGLASFNAERRRKEIGVRKVMGGSVWRIVLLLTNDFSKLVLISNFIAWPIAYFAMNLWLENFAYRIGLSPMLFVGSGCIALCIAWVTVGGTAAKAASAKPVLALRYE